MSTSTPIVGSGKKRYLDQAAAEAALGRVMRSFRRTRQNNRRDRTMNAYRCGHCGFYHLGHSRQRGNTA